MGSFPNKTIMGQGGGGGGWQGNKSRPFPSFFLGIERPGPAPLLCRSACHVCENTSIPPQVSMNRAVC